MTFSFLTLIKEILVARIEKPLVFLLVSVVLINYAAVMGVSSQINEKLNGIKLDILISVEKRLVEAEKDFSKNNINLQNKTKKKGKNI